jgi:hypothetical protein
MLPGPICLYRCGSCNDLFSRRTLASGNTLGAQYRSDGQMKARMLPQTPPLVVCPHCQALFCMLDAEHAVEFRNYFLGWGFLGEPKPEEVASKKAQEALAMALHYLRASGGNVPSATRKAVQALGALNRLEMLSLGSGAQMTGRA